MKKSILSLMPLLFAACVAILVSCQSKSRVDELKDLVEEIKEKGNSFTEEQWEKTNAQFDKLMKKLNEYQDLSTEEMQEVARLQGEYAATVFKNKGKKALEDMKKAGTAIDGFIDGLAGGDENMEEAEKEDK